MIIVDNKGKKYDFTIKENKVILQKESIDKGIEYVDVVFDEYSAVAGDEGYYVISDTDKKGSCLCRFTQKEDAERIYKQNLMPFFGVKNKKVCDIIIACGMKNEFYVCLNIKSGIYDIAARFVLDGDEPYEDISFMVHHLDINDGYSEMAAYYREYQLTRGVCIPLKERIKQNEQLEYAVDSVEIRIRMGWKPAPPKVLEQTPENEPEMKKACDFNQIKFLVDELERQGVDKAQICLVGWNKSGHDGRYPQLFPVEEKLGGEEALREAICYAQKKGYQIVCHTNSTDCYSIADCFDEDIVVKKKNGEMSTNELSWSGGKSYQLCPEKALEFAKRDLPKVRELGFSGIHYIDVMSVVPLISCYDKRHPVNSKRTEDIYAEIGTFTQKLFGGYASEGAFDFAVPYLDYALYVNFDKNTDYVFDEEIPLWQLVYHGIVLSNPSTATVNYPIKSPDNRLKLFEYGGRPAFYFNSKFLAGSNQDDWLGKEDITTASEDSIIEGVKYIKEAYDEYVRMRRLQYEFIENHTSLGDNTYSIRYSDGTKVEVDYNSNSINITEK